MMLLALQVTARVSTDWSNAVFPARSGLHDGGGGTLSARLDGAATEGWAFRSRTMIRLSGSCLTTFLDNAITPRDAVKAAGVSWWAYQTFIKKHEREIEEETQPTHDGGKRWGWEGGRSSIIGH
jgi:hypothetical protein